MKVTREEDNTLFTLIKVKPWPTERFAADVTVIHERRDRDTGDAINYVRVIHGPVPVTYQTAREWAQAILRACDIAEQLEREGRIVLEGEPDGYVLI